MRNTKYANQKPSMPNNIPNVNLYFKIFIRCFVAIQLLSQIYFFGVLFTDLKIWWHIKNYNIRFMQSFSFPKNTLKASLSLASILLHFSWELFYSRSLSLWLDSDDVWDVSWRKATNSSFNLSALENNPRIKGHLLNPWMSNNQTTILCHIFVAFVLNKNFTKVEFQLLKIYFMLFNTFLMAGKCQGTERV